jgi:hypothetical protein
MRRVLGPNDPATIRVEKLLDEAVVRRRTLATEAAQAPQN